MMRLFIAYPLATEVREQLDRLIQRLRSCDRSVKWVSAKNIHLTLRFLGDTEERLVPSLKDAVDRVTDRVRLSNCVIDRLGGFPNLNRPRVIWAGLKGDTEALSVLASELERAVQQLGFEAENKQFRPHITVGRVRTGRLSPELAELLARPAVTAIPVVFDRVALIKSTLTPSGPIYDVLHERQLG